MITFEFKDAIARGSAAVAANGDVTQRCLITTEITGAVIQGKLLTDLEYLTVPNSILDGSNKPAVAAMDYINDTLAPDWVTANYVSE